jgi:hypothetical protein
MDWSINIKREQLMKQMRKSTTTRALIIKKWCKERKLQQGEQAGINFVVA